MTEPRELTPLDAALITLYGTGHGGRSPYDVEKRIRDKLGGLFGYGKSTAYARTRKLATEGYLHALARRVGQRKTLYLPTELGLDALKAWLQTPAQAPQIDSEAFVRTRALALLANPTTVLFGLRALRPELKMRLAEFGLLEEELRRLEHGQARSPEDLSIGLELDLHQSVLNAYLGWVTRAEKKLARWEREAKEAISPPKKWTPKRLPGGRNSG